MEFTVRLEPDPEGGFVVQCLEVPGAISQGDTEKEALDNIRDAIRMILTSRRDRAKALGARLATVEVRVEASA